MFGIKKKREKKDECIPVESEISVVEILNDFYSNKNIPPRTGSSLTQILIIPDTDNRNKKYKKSL